MADNCDGLHVLLRTMYIKIYKDILIKTTFMPVCIPVWDSPIKMAYVFFGYR